MYDIARPRGVFLEVHANRLALGDGEAAGMKQIAAQKLGRRLHLGALLHVCHAGHRRAGNHRCNGQTDQLLQQRYACLTAGMVLSVEHRKLLQCVDHASTVEIG